MLFGMRTATNKATKSLSQALSYLQSRNVKWKGQTEKIKMVFVADLIAPGGAAHRRVSQRSGSGPRSSPSRSGITALAALSRIVFRVIGVCRRGGSGMKQPSLVMSGRKASRWS
jgi:hypothetical protein